MTRILLLGLDPETVDFSDPALPPAMTAEKVRAGIAVALKQFSDRGWESDVGFIRPDKTAGPTVERQLCSTNYDCVVIGGGVRLPPRNLALFEVVINAVRKAAPGRGDCLQYTARRQRRCCRPMGGGWKPSSIVRLPTKPVRRLRQCPGSPIRRRLYR